MLVQDVLVGLAAVGGEGDGPVVAGEEGTDYFLIAMHEVHETAGDRESPTAAAELAGVRVIGLREWFEDDIEILRARDLMIIYGSYSWGR